MNRLLQRLSILIIALSSTAALSFGQLYVDADATGNNDGSTWADAYVDLQDALAAALPDDEIWVAEGTYVPGTDTLDYFQLVEGVRLYGGFAGTETSEGERDPAANVTVLSGDPVGNDVPGDFTNNRDDNVFHVLLADTNITNATVVDGFTISGGASPDPTRDGLPGLIRDSGGGILTLGSPVISNCIFTHNSASRGGAVYAQGAGASSIKFLGCEFEGNTGRFGGAIMFISLDGGLVDNCSFDGNSSGVSGFAIYNGGSIDTIQNSTFDQNTGTFGTIMNDGSLGYYSNLDFTSNEATNLGGGILLLGGESIYDNCTFNGNVAGNAGAVFGFDGDAIFNDCDFIANTADAGGVGFIQGGSVTFNGCLLEQNIGGNFGGAGLTGFGASSSFTNCIFRENESTRLGAAWWTQNDSTTNEFIGCQFIENIIQGGTASLGNALAFGQGSFNIVDSCFFDGNNNGFNPDFGSGGAIWFGGDTIRTASGDVIRGRLSLTRSQFYSNQATVQGGAVDLSTVDATIENCVFAFNQSTAGTIINNGGTRFGSPLTLTNNTFYLNMGSFGSGLVQWENPSDTVMAQGSAVLQNNIFVAGDGPAYAVEDGTPTIISNGGNLVQDASLDTAATADDIENVTEAEVALADPFSVDFTLTSNSIAIDAGVNSGAPTVDLTGEVRLSGNNTIVDAGAYEFGTVSSTNLVSDFGIGISPTVTSDMITVTFNSEATGDLELRVYDYQGKMVMLENEVKGTTNFIESYNVGHLPAGTYFVRVIAEGKIGGGKFIVTQ